MKAIISTGPGRLHLIESVVALKKEGLDIEFITGWVPFDYLPDKAINLLGRLVGRNNIAYGLRKRKPLLLNRNQIHSCAFAEFSMNLLIIFSRFKIINRNNALAIGWKIYNWQSKKNISNVDIFHVRSGAGNCGAIEKAKKCGMTVIADHSAAHPFEIYSQLSKAYEGMENPFNPNTGLWKMVLEDCDNADFILVNSDYVKDSFIKYGFDNEKIFVIPLGIRPDFLSLKKEYIVGDEIKLLYVGAFNRWKGAHLIMQAIERLINNNINFRIDIIGTIADDLFIPEFFRNHTNVHFHGHIPQDNLKKYLNESDLFIFPSYCEGSAQAVKEAMAAGLPVITTTQSGAQIIHNENGWIIPDHSAAALADAIIFLANNSSLCKKLGNNAINTIKEGHTWGHYAKKVIMLYQQVV